MNLDITYMNMSMNMNMNQGRKEGRKEWGGVFRGWHDIFPSPESPDEVFQPNVCELRFSVFPPGNHFSFHQLWWRRS